MEELIYITRVVEFSAAHRLFREEWSEEKNRSVFGKCANPFGHGHNYKLRVTFKGKAQPDTGMVVHFDSLKRMLYEYVESPLDHRHLNHDVAFMKDILPTLENLVVVLWKRISEAIASEPYSLHKLILSSSDNSLVEYEGGCDE